MKKWQVTIEVTIQAEERSQAWRIANEVIHDKLRDLAMVVSIPQKPVPDPEQWIALNEPIRSRS